MVDRNKDLFSILLFFSIDIFAIRNFINADTYEIMRIMKIYLINHKIYARSIILFPHISIKFDKDLTGEQRPELVTR